MQIYQWWEKRKKEYQTVDVMYKNKENIEHRMQIDMIGEQCRQDKWDTMRKTMRSKENEWTLIYSN